MIPIKNVRRRRDRPLKSNCPRCNCDGEHHDTKIRRGYRVLYFRCRDLNCNTRWADKQELMAIIQNRKISSDKLTILQPEEAFAPD